MEILVIIASGAEPWFRSWNFESLQSLFKVLPHTSLGIGVARFFLENPLLTTWMYAAVSYVYWSKRDDQQEAHRVQLLRTAAACILAVAVAALLDLKIGWPSPARNPDFQVLFPHYLWGVGTANSFPSHSTLAYLTVAIGLSQLNRMAGWILIPLTFLAISLPRVYLGGHYFIDLGGSIVLALLALAATDIFLTVPRVAQTFEWLASPQVACEVVFFFWLYELGEGFRGVEDLVHFALKLGRS
jgi:membrane-associated phospholipid phosphatase